MLDIDSAQGTVALVLAIILFAVKAFALVDCIGRSARQFEYSESLTKNAWLIILGLAVAVSLVSWNPLGILNLVGTVAALVYLAQMRGSSR